MPLGRAISTTEGHFWDMYYGNLSSERTEEAEAMKGFYTGNGYCGYVDGRYVLFSSESEYYECVGADAD